jgi:hypothetical protein
VASTTGTPRYSGPELLRHAALEASTRSILQNVGSRQVSLSGASAWRTWCWWSAAKQHLAEYSCYMLSPKVIAFLPSVGSLINGQLGCQAYHRLTARLSCGTKDRFSMDHHKNVWPGRFLKNGRFPPLRSPSRLLFGEEKYIRRRRGATKDEIAIE